VLNASLKKAHMEELDPKGVEAAAPSGEPDQDDEP
jgi:hypothetical protein